MKLVKKRKILDEHKIKQSDESPEAAVAISPPPKEEIKLENLICHRKTII